MPAGIHRQFALEAHQRLCMHLEFFSGSYLTSSEIGDVQRQLDILHSLRLTTIIDGQSTTEGLTCHGHGLVNLQCDR